MELFLTADSHGTGAPFFGGGFLWFWLGVRLSFDLLQTRIRARHLVVPVRSGGAEGLILANLDQGASYDSVIA